MSERIFGIIGPSGSGKSVIGEHLKTLGVGHVVSHTTRPRRKGEKHNRDFYFVSDDEFDNIPMIEVTHYSGYRYGVSDKEMKACMMMYDKLFIICDRVGMEQFKLMYPDKLVSIYVMISIEEMRARLAGRGMTKDDIIKRMMYAYKTNEMSIGAEYDYVLRNKQLNKTLLQLENIVLNIETGSCLDNLF